MLEAHFINQSFSLQSKEERFRRRVPAKELESENCKNDLACAGRLATAEAETQFTVSGCVTCHEVETLDNVEPRSRWQVLPVKLNSDWYSRARFDHRSHLTQSGEQANALCLSCHKAETSSKSSDILIPTKDNCLQCHDDRGHGQMLKLDCVSCHAYHLSEQRQLFKPLQELQDTKP
jgi:predicted CXXCH cytochrome family protein